MVVGLVKWWWVWIVHRGIDRPYVVQVAYPIEVLGERDYSGFTSRVFPPPSPSSLTNLVT